MNAILDMTEWLIDPLFTQISYSKAFNFVKKKNENIACAN